MKSLSEIISQQPVYLNHWKITEDIEKDFFCGFDDYQWDDEVEDYVEKDTRKLDKESVLFASYGTDNYAGSAFVLYEEDGKLFEVHGSHCSCYGLENQWEPEEVLLKELEHRLLEGTFGEDNWTDNNFKKELCSFLGVEFRLNEESYDWEDEI